MIIKNKYTDDVIIEASTIEEAIDLSKGMLQCANLDYLDLSDLDLSGANLQGANLINANLDGCDLRHTVLDTAILVGSSMVGAEMETCFLRQAILDDANMTNANLSRADFSHCDLQTVTFTGARINWNSHDLIAEILRRESGGDFEKLKAAGFLLVNRDKCWTQYADYYNSFFLLDDRVLMDWAITTLRNYIRPEDDTVPELVLNWSTND